MADDFDESAALPVDQVIAELRESLGIADDVSTTEPAPDKKTATKPDDKDQSDDTTVTEKKESDVVDDDDKEETLTIAEEKAVEKAAPEGPSSALAKILAKYGYDEEKFAEGWYNLQNSTALTVKRLERMEELLAKQTGSDEPHPDIVKLNNELEDLTEDIKENRERQKALVTKGEGIRDKMSTLKGRIEATEDGNTKDALRGQIESLKDSLDTQGERWRDIERENKRLLRKAQSIDSRRKDVETEIKTNGQETRDREQSLRVWQEDQNFRFTTALKALSGIYEMSPAQHGAINRLIKDDVREYIKKYPDGDPIDLVKFVGARAKTHTADLNIKTKFAKTGDDKKQVVVSTSGKRTTKPPTVPQKSNERKDTSNKAEEDAATARAEARRIMGAV